MKSKVIFVMLSAAMSLPVMAQQVTAYGIIDQAVRSTKLDGQGSQTTLVSGSYATSRLGFRGTEDLGGGIRASFVLEGRLDGTDGTLGSSGNLFSREASVSLHSAVGTVTLGRTDTSASEGVDTFVGNHHFGNFTFVGAGIELAGDRASTLRYTTPTLGGVTVQLGRSLAVGQAPETDSVSATLVLGNLGLAAGYDRAGADNYRAVGARYDFGFASVGGMYGKRESTRTDFTAISARVPLPGNFALLGSYRITETAAQKVTASAVGASKSLSPRTQLVAVFQDTDRGASAGNLFQGGLVHSF
jgi:predicted porin